MIRLISRSFTDANDFRLLRSMWMEHAQPVLLESPWLEKEGIAGYKAFIRVQIKLS